jgi:hypothetical protein
MEFKKLSGVLHILLISFAPFFPLFFPSLDLLYVLFFLLLYLHWTLLDGECIISLFFKLYENKTYIIGSNPFSLPDVHSIIPPNLLNILLPIMSSIVLVSNFIVFKRYFGDFFTIILLISLCLFVFFMMMKQRSKETMINAGYIISREILKIYLVVLITVIILPYR